MLTKEEKEKILKDYENTGSSEAQIALLSAKIKKLFPHFKENQKDQHSKRGLLKAVSKRRKLLSYLRKKDEERYNKLVQRLGLKK